jgi:hypothetical protein
VGLDEQRANWASASNTGLLREALDGDHPLSCFSTRRGRNSWTTVRSVSETAQAALKVNQTAGKRTLNLPVRFVYGSSRCGGCPGTAGFSQELKSSGLSSALAFFRSVIDRAVNILESAGKCSGPQL